MNGETAFKFVFICELKFSKVGDHHFQDQNLQTWNFAGSSSLSLGLENSEKNRKWSTRI